MKLALFLCLFALCNAAPTPDGSESGEQSAADNETVQIKVDKVIEAGAPRQFGNRASARACSNNCERTWRQEQGLSSSGGDNWNLNKFCEAHDKFTQCLNACGTSDDKTKLLEKISKDQFICHESTYNKTLICLNEAFKQTSATCNSFNKCGKHDNDDGSLRDMVKQLCLSLKCKLDCRGPTILSKCGQAALNDEKGVIKKTIGYLKWRVVDSAGRQRDWPAHECDPLLRI